jgi:hypothetical protein
VHQDLMNRTLTKKQIAVIQLEQSLALLQRDDPVSALTLAGAAEEILGYIADKRGHEPQVYVMADWLGSLFERANQPRPKKDYLIRFFNSARNHAKHQTDGINIRISADWHFEAENMLIRCMLNHRRVFGRYPASKALRLWMANIVVSSNRLRPSLTR